MRIPFFSRKSAPEDPVRIYSTSSPEDAKALVLLGKTDSDIGPGYMSQINQGLSQNPYVARCIELRASTVASLTPILYDSDGNEIDDRNHPLRKVLKNPGGRRTWRKFVYELESDFALNGNAYIYVIDTVEGFRLRRVPPDCATPIVTGNTLDPVDGWQINAGTAMISVPVEQLIHLRTTAGPDRITGISPLMSAAQSISAQTEARIWNKTLMRNGAKPSMVVMSPKEVPPSQYFEYKREMQKKYGGAQNAGSIMILDGGKTVDFNGFSARDMDFSAGVTMTAREIDLALGVPPELVGDSANKTYSNAQEANKEFALHTVKPLADDLYEALTLALCPKFGDVDRIGYDESQIEGMKGDMATLLQAVTSADFLTDDEKRAIFSYAPLDPEINGSGDVVMSGMSKVPRKEVVSDPGAVGNDNRDDPLNGLLDGL